MMMVGVFPMLSCSAKEKEWHAAQVDTLLGIEDGADQYGDLTTHYQGVVLRRGSTEIVLVYVQWPSDKPKPAVGDTVRILTDLAEVDPVRWGYWAEEVDIEVVRVNTF